MITTQYYVLADVVTYIRFAHELVRHNVARPDEHRDRIPQSGTGKRQCVRSARKPTDGFRPDASGLRFPRATLCGICTLKILTAIQCKTTTRSRSHDILL